MKNTTRILITALFPALLAGPALAEHGHRDRDDQRGKGHYQERRYDRHHGDRAQDRHGRRHETHRHAERHADRHAARHDHRYRPAHPTHGWQKPKHHSFPSHGWDRPRHPAHPSHGWHKPKHHDWHKPKHHEKHHDHARHSRHDRRYQGRVNGYYYASTPWKIQLFDRHHRLHSSIPLGRGAQWRVKGDRIVVYGRHHVHVYGGPRFHLLRSYNNHRRHHDSGLNFSFRF